MCWTNQKKAITHVPKYVKVKKIQLDLFPKSFGKKNQSLLDE